MACAHNHREPKATPAVEALEWYQDCLVLTALLASAFGSKAMRKLLKRAGYLEAAQAERADVLLAALHGACHHDQELRAEVTRELNARFPNALSRVQGLGVAGVVQEADQKPWSLPLLWACFQHPDGEMRKTGRQLAHLALLRGLRQAPGQGELEQARQRSETLARQNQALRGQLAEARQERDQALGQLHGQRAQPRPAPGPDAPGLAAFKKEAQELRRRLEHSEDQRRELGEQLALWRSLALRGQARAEADGPCRAEAGPPPAPALQDATALLDAAPDCGDLSCCPLRGRKVAVVGGLKRLEKSYCELVGRMGGQCLCHSGEMQAGAAKLRQLVAKSDMVVCIASVNSHGAMNVVKKQCKRCRKPFCPLNGAGVGALENLLRQVSGGA